MNHPQPIAFEQYNQHFDAAEYENLAVLLASNLYAERDDPRVVTGMNLLIDTCLELCGSAPQDRSWHQLAVFCGQNGIIKYTIDALVSYLRRFATDDTRIDDFECTAKALLLAYGAQMDANHAAAHANGIHSWQGRAAYELLVSADYLTQAAIQLLAHGEERYLHEKLTYGLNRITSALYEGIRTSDTPEQFDFHSIYFPQVSDRQ